MILLHWRQSAHPRCTSCSTLCRRSGTPSARGGILFDARGVPARIDAIERETAHPDIWSNTRRANTLFAELRGLKKLWDPVSALATEVESLRSLAQQAAPEDFPMIGAETERLARAWSALETQLYLNGEFDREHCYLTVSAGAGGTEAQDWAAMLLRMILRYCERRGYRTQLLDETRGQEAGIKSATILVQGDFAYGNLKCERGTHRLVRLSPFNAKNLRQTSFALIEVLPEIPETTTIVIPPQELKVDTFRSGGAGGQHVNKTESAVRITHLPTGIVVSCQNERSQLQNRERAMAMLAAKLLERQRATEQATKAELKGAQQSADFGQQIRSYVLHPYQMVKDLRTDIETSDTAGVLDGDLQPFIDAELRRAHAR